MHSRLDELRITTHDLDSLTGLDISDIFMGRAVRPSVFRHPKRSLSFVVSEIMTLGLIVIFCLPASLVIAKSSPGFTDSAANTIQFLHVSVGISLAIFALWNGYLWFRSTALKTLAHLLDDVDKHNEIIDALQVLDELVAVQNTSAQRGINSTFSLENRTDVLQALGATRESLVCGLMTERVLRKHQRSLARRHDLFTNIETNLATLQTLQMNQSANDYGHLLNDALQIGMSVRREIEQLK